MLTKLKKLNLFLISLDIKTKLFILGVFLDILTTLVGMNFFDCIEMNQLFNNHPAFMYITKFMYMIAVCCFIEKFKEEKALWIIPVPFFMVSIWNITQMF
jgi:hypothetical protein